jgi:hypothetical protein
MAAGPGGIGALIMSALSGRTAMGGGTPGGAPGMPGGGGDPSGGDPGGSQYAQQVAQLKGADPGMLMQEMKSMKQKCAVLMVQNLERLPNVSGHLSKLIPMFDRVLKEISQAQNVNQAVQPLGMGAAMPPTSSPNATPPTPGGN